MKPEDLERRRNQLDTFFNMFFGWGRRNDIPLLRVPCVQRFICQEGELPPPDRNVAIDRLMPAHLASAELKAGAPAGATLLTQTPPRGSGGGGGGDGNGG